jgi:GNAT superfamily N-acetyltransferase
MSRDAPARRPAPSTARRAVDTDADAVAQVLIDSRRAAVGSIPPSVHHDDGIRGWVASHVLPECEVWVTDAGDPGDGLSAVLVLEDDWIDQLYVAPPSWGRGLGTFLVELAKQRRPDGLQLWTFASNEGAQRFYRRHGFVEAERTDGSGNEEGAPDIRFVWPGATDSDAGSA